MGIQNQEIKDFGLRLSQLREAKGWTQLDMHYESGIDPSYISRIERGVVNPSLTVIITLARALGCSIDELIKL